MKKNNKIKVSMHYSWEFSLKDWEEFKECDTKSQINKLKTKLQWDPISAFHHLNDMAYPDVRMSLEPVSKKSN